MKPAQGNMYNFVSHVWSPVRGWPCPHECEYCYVKRMSERFKYGLGKLRIISKEFTDLGSGNTIFVCHETDLFAQAIPKYYINWVLEHCKKYPENTYLFQSKNPARFFEFGLEKWENVILATTVETDMGITEYEKISRAPHPLERLKAIIKIKGKWLITIEPIMKFSPEFASKIIATNPDMIAIGADSKKCNLYEPLPEEVRNLIKELKAAKIRIFIKKNLKRLCPELKEGWFS